MVEIEKLLDIIHEKDIQHREKEYIRTILEALANDQDNEIMKNLMLKMIEKNASLNYQLTLKINEVEKLSITDQLTGLYNRRELIARLEAQLELYRRYNTTFSIIMFDIDHFKSVNDNYGHDIGDYVLVTISDIVRKRLRLNDTFARWGGEEFIILLPSADENEAISVAESIRKLVESHHFTPVPKITCSFGVTEVQADDIDTITKHVDIALYQSKESGRNKVSTYQKKSTN